MKENNIHVTSAIYIHTESSNWPYANISHFEVMDQDRKQLAREAIHIRMNNPALNCTTRIMYILEIFNSLLGADKLSDGSVKMADPNKTKQVSNTYFFHSF